ncbi:MAG: MFS transporter [Planctomycetia bacterium]|nr:MFS transporter [Planctomycetia bacterium]
MFQPPQHAPPSPAERRILFIVGAVQFVNILDFMMVMPLGPDFGAKLGIPNSHIGWIGGAYTAAAAISGVICSAFLDRFDRRKALAVAMLGLVLGTAAGGFAVGLNTLMAARVAAGAFGGPATSISLSIIADVIPPHRRGKAMGAVMAAFSIASVLGVPAGLELARHAGWRSPFFSVAALGFLVAAGAVALMPSMRAHLDHPRPPGSGMLSVFRDPGALSALASVATVYSAAFMIIPNISPFLQFNCHYPRAQLPLLYMVGGAISFFVMPVIGRLVDRLSPAPVSALGTVLFVAILWLGYSRPGPLPVMVVFVGFMVGMSFRNVPMTSLSTRGPLPHQRAGFMSAQSAVQHLAASAGAALSSGLLRELPDRSLDGMPAVTGIAIGLALALPALVAITYRYVKAREALSLRPKGSETVRVPAPEIR